MNDFYILLAQFFFYLSFIIFLYLSQENKTD